MEDKLDRLLEGALREYANVPAPPGLSARVQRHIRRADTNRKFAAIAGAVAALAAMAVLIIHRPTVRHTEPGTHSVRLITAVTLPVPPLPIGQMAAPTRRRLVKKRDLPKLDAFPASAPLTGEEKALLAMMRRYPDETVKVFARASEQMNKPAQIEPVTITPIEPPTVIGENK